MGLPTILCFSHTPRAVEHDAWLAAISCTQDGYNVAQYSSHQQCNWSKGSGLSGHASSTTAFSATTLPLGYLSPGASWQVIVTLIRHKSGSCTLQLTSSPSALPVQTHARDPNSGMISFCHSVMTEETSVVSIEWNPARGLADSIWWGCPAHLTDEHQHQRLPRTLQPPELHPSCSSNWTGLDGTR